MEFTVGERFTMLNLLPPEGNLITVKLIHELRQGLAFSEEDIKALDIQQSDGQLRWKNDIGPKEVKVGIKAAGVIHDELKKLDKDGKLQEAHLSLADKFEYEG